MAAFNSINAEYALVQLWREVKSKPEDPEASNLEIPSPPSTEDAVTAAIDASSEFADTTPPIRVPHAFITSAARHLLGPSELQQRERQLLVVSTTNETVEDWNRQMVALSVPHAVAKQLLSLSVAVDLSTQVLPQFTAEDAAHTLVAMSDSATRPTRSLTKESAIRTLIELLRPNNTVRTVHTSTVFTPRELNIAVKLINLLRSHDTEALYEAVRGVNEQEFRATHLLLNRFEFPQRPLNAEYAFNAGDVAAAHQLLHLFNTVDPPREIGPLYLAYPAAPGARGKQLVLLSDGDGAERLLVEAYHRGYAARTTQ